MSTDYTCHTINIENLGTHPKDKISHGSYGTIYNYDNDYVLKEIKYVPELDNITNFKNSVYYEIINHITINKMNRKLGLNKDVSFIDFKCYQMDNKKMYIVLEKIKDSKTFINYIQYYNPDYNTNKFKLHNHKINLTYPQEIYFNKHIKPNIHKFKNVYQSLLTKFNTLSYKYFKTHNKKFINKMNDLKTKINYFESLSKLNSFNDFIKLLNENIEDITDSIKSKKIYQKQIEIVKITKANINDFDTKIQTFKNILNGSKILSKPFIPNFNNDTVYNKYYNINTKRGYDSLQFLYILFHFYNIKPLIKLKSNKSHSNLINSYIQKDLKYLPHFDKIVNYDFFNPIKPFHITKAGFRIMEYIDHFNPDTHPLYKYVINHNELNNIDKIYGDILILYTNTFFKTNIHLNKTHFKLISVNRIIKSKHGYHSDSAILCNNHWIYFDSNNNTMRLFINKSLHTRYTIKQFIKKSIYSLLFYSKI